MHKNIYISVCLFHDVNSLVVFIYIVHVAVFTECVTNGLELAGLISLMLIWSLIPRPQHVHRGRLCGLFFKAKMLPASQLYEPFRSTSMSTRYLDNPPSPSPPLRK